MTMHFVLQTPSLQHLAGLKIVAHLWTQRDIIAQMARDFYEFHFYMYLVKETSTKWKAIAEKVKSKVRALPLPQPCKEPLLILMKPLGVEIMRWCMHHRVDKDIYYLLKNLLPQQLCFTMHGPIDYAKTAQLLVKDERLDVERRYILARLHFLEEEARELFEAMDEERRQESVKKMLSCFGRTTHHHPAQSNRTVDSPDDSLNRIYCFRGALLYGDGATSEYWFTKLNQEEKERVLDDREMRQKSLMLSRASSLLYYLSRMSEEQREGMFRECTRHVLIGLLRWPLQSLFMEAVECGWSYMNEEIYVDVVGAITNQITNGFQASQLFWEFWCKSPAEYKRHFLSNIYRLDFLVATKDEEIIKLVFKEASLYILENYFQRRYDIMRQVLMDESVMSDAALLEWKEGDALNSSNDPQDEEKRLRSEYVGLLVDGVMKSRMERRECTNAENKSIEFY